VAAVTNDALVGDPIINAQFFLDRVDPTNSAFLTGTVKTGLNYRGFLWHDGRRLFSTFQTIMPPNCPSCARGGGE